MGKNRKTMGTKNHGDGPAGSAFCRNRCLKTMGTDLLVLLFAGTDA